MDKTKIFVYAGWEDNKIIGTIFSDILNGNEVVSFAYDSEWLQKHPFLIRTIILEIMVFCSRTIHGLYRLLMI